MAKELAIVKGERVTPKQKRERIELVETPPQDHWFVQGKTHRGRRVWYLRFQITGQYPRLYGPLPSKRHCLLFLDEMIGRLLEGMSEAEDYCNKRMVNEEFMNVWIPLVEHPDVINRHSPATKGR